MTADLHDDRERLRDDLAAYALGALDEPEARVLERHLAECEACRERVGWLRPAVDVLPATVEQLTPPEHLRESLMAVVRAEAEVDEAPEPEPGQVARARARSEPWWRRWSAAALRPAVVMTALIVLAVGIGAGYLLRGSGTEEAGPTLVKAEPTKGNGDLVSLRSNGTSIELRARIDRKLVEGVARVAEEHAADLHLDVEVVRA